MRAIIRSAPASLLTVALRDLTLEEAEALLNAFRGAVDNGKEGEILPDALTALNGVGRFPSRNEFATLPRESLAAALEGWGGGDGKCGAGVGSGTHRDEGVAPTVRLPAPAVHG